MLHKMFTLDDLYNFYSQQNRNCIFSAKAEDSVIIVQVPEIMNFSDGYDPTYNLLPVHLMSCHLLENLNKSSISKKAMDEAIPSFKNRPILGYIQKIDDGDGTFHYDFAGHEMEVGEDGNIEYKEAVVGVIPESCNPKIVHNEEYDKDYLEVDGLIYEDYTHAADILRRKGECAVSVEISVDELSYSADTKILNIDQFHFLGVTILGVTTDEQHKQVMPGMQGANIKISDFSAENNSMFSHNTKLIETLDKLNETLAKFNIDPAMSGELKEGGNLVNKFEELLNIYNKTVDEITFEYDGLSDEELETKFAEVFGNPESTSEQFDGEGGDGEEGGDGAEPGAEPGEGNDPPADDGDGKEETPEPTEDDIAAADAVTDAIEALTDDSGLDEVQAAADAYDELTDLQKSLVETETVAALDVQVSRAANIRSEDEVGESRQNNSLEYSATFNGVTRTSFATLNEQLEALWTLVNDTYGEMDNEWYSVDADPDKKVVYMHGWNNHYRQSYKVKNDVFSLVGDRIPVYCLWVTEDEKKELENLKSSYSSIESELNEYKENELHAQREAVFATDDYSVLADDVDFIALKDSMDDYTPEELSEKADLIYAKFMKSNYSKISAGQSAKKTTVFMSSGNDADDKKRKPYGGIFENYFKNKKR